MKNMIIFIFALFFISKIALAASPAITDIASIAAQDPTPGSTTTVIMWFVANDDDGYTDLNDSTAAVYFTMGEAERSNTTCSVTGINSTANNYSCAVAMLFYDAPGSWNINVSVSDSGGNYTENTTTTFTYNTGLHMTMTPTAINFGTDLAVGQQDIEAVDDPIVITNAGNVNITEVSVVAYDLVGETYSPCDSCVIPADNFECDIDDVADDNIQLADSSYSYIDSITLIPRGENSTASLFYHVDIPSTYIQVQTYSTAGGSDWEIIVSD